MFEHATLEGRHRRHPNKRLAAFLERVSRILLGAAGLLFFFGGGLLHAVADTERLLAEMIGIGLAFVFVVVGVIAKSGSENFAPDPDQENSVST